MGFIDVATSAALLEKSVTAIYLVSFDGLWRATKHGQLLIVSYCLIIYSLLALKLGESARFNAPH